MMTMDTTAPTQIPDIEDEKDVVTTMMPFVDEQDDGTLDTINTIMDPIDQEMVDKTTISTTTTTSTTTSKTIEDSPDTEM